MRQRLHARLGSAFIAALALGAVTGAGAQDDAAATVYKCTAANGTVTYQDYACKGGVTVDIKPDAADPAAIERLRRAQAQFDRAAAQRKSAEATAIHREAFFAQPEPPQPAPSQSYEDDAAGMPYLFVVPVRPVRPRGHDRQVEHRRVAPATQVPARIRNPQANRAQPRDRLHFM